MPERSGQQATPLRVFVAGGSRLCREALAKALGADGGLQTTVVDTPERIHGRSGSAWVVLLICAPIPGTGNSSAEWKLPAPPWRCLLLCDGSLPRAVTLGLLRMEIGGIFDANQPLAELSGALRMVAQGGKWLGGGYLEQLVDAVTGKSNPMQLPPLERDVLVLVAEGLSNKEIGQRLGISEAAMKAALQRLFRKAGVRTRTQLVRAALQGWLAAGSDL